MSEAKKKRLRTWWKRIAIDLVIICIGQYLLCCAFGFFKINAFMFHPPIPCYSWQDMPYIVNVGDEAAPVAAMWVPCAGTNKVILYNHGNAEDLNDFAGIAKDFQQAGFSVLCYDYPGYGMSAGKPTERGVYAAAEAAYRFLTGRCGVAPSDIIVLGRSIGSGPACYLAEKFPVGGLVTEAGFTSAPRIVTCARILPFDPFPNIRRIPNVSCPKLFIHGTVDHTVPFSHSKALFAAAKAPKAHLAVDGAGHDDLMSMLGHKEYFKALRTFTDP